MSKRCKYCNSDAGDAAAMYASNYHKALATIKEKDLEITRLTELLVTVPREHQR